MKSVMPFNKDYLVVVYMQDVTDSIEIFNMTSGKLIGKLSMPMIGTVSGLGGEASRLLFKMTSFLIPGIVYEYDLNDKNFQPKV